MFLSRTPKTAEPPRPLTVAQAERDAAARLVLAQNTAALAALEDQAALAKEVRDAEAAKVRSELTQTAKADKARISSEMLQAWGRIVVPYFPLIMFNTLAVFGQLGWGRQHLVQIGANANSPARWLIAILFAATLESAALFLAYYANRALNRGDSATSLYLGAFGMAFVVAGVNYSHYAVTGTPADPGLSVLGLITIPDPTAMGVVFSLCSLASPWLWRIKHRDANRDRLYELGVIDAKAVKLSMASKIFYPIRSFQVTRRAVWERETNPIKAVENWEAHRARLQAAKEAKAQERAEHRAARVAQKETKESTASETKTKELENKDVKELDAAPSEPVADPNTPPEIPAPRDPSKALVLVPPPYLGRPPEPVQPPLPPEATKFPEMWKAVRITSEAGNQITQRALAREYTQNNNRHQAKAVLAAYDAWKGVNEDGNRTRSAASN